MPKPGKGETLDRAAFRDYVRPLVEELDNEAPELESRDDARPDKQIHNFGKRGN